MKRHIALHLLSTRPRYACDSVDFTEKVKQHEHALSCSMYDDSEERKVLKENIVLQRR